MRIVHNTRMIVLIFSAVVLFAPFFAQKASALELYNNDELLSKLKKNQLLSEKDISEIKGSYPKVELMGTLQLRYTNGLGSSGTENISDLSMRRLNFKVAALLTDKIGFVLEPEYAKGEPSIKDAYLEYKPSGFDVFAGNHRVPFSADALKNDINLTFAERNLGAAISPNYLPGVSIAKSLFSSKVMAQAGLWNGNINSNAETNLINNSLADNQIFSSSIGPGGSNILIEALRIAYSSKGFDTVYPGGRGFEDDENFSGLMSYGAGFSFYNSTSLHDKAPANGLTGLNGASAYEFDLLFKIWRISSEFEYAKRNLDWWQYNVAQTSNSSVASSQSSVSFQASILAVGNLSLGARYESFVYDDKGTVLKGVYGQDKDRWLTAGLNYYFKAQHTKIQANYVKKTEVMPTGVAAPKNNNTVYLQATMYF